MTGVGPSPPILYDTQDTMSAAATHTASRSAPSLPTRKEAMAIHKNRLAGLYNSDETHNEAWLAFNQMTPDDVVITLLHAHGRFSIYNLHEFLPQIQEWKAKGIACLPCNVKEIKFGDEIAWAFVIQPKKLDDAPMCPLSLCLNTLVSGFTYITKDKKIADLVVRALRKE